MLDSQEMTPLAVTATYQVSELLLEQIQREMLLEAKNSEFSRITDYRGGHQVVENGFDKCELETAQGRLNEELLPEAQPEKKRRFFLFGKKEKAEPRYTNWLEI